MHTQFFLHSLYALYATLVSLAVFDPSPPSPLSRSARGNALEVVLAHGSIAAVSVQALDALGSGLLARVEPFAFALAASLLGNKVSDWN